MIILLLTREFSEKSNFIFPQHISFNTRCFKMLNNNLKAKSHSSSTVYPWDHFNAMRNEGDGLHSVGYFMVTSR